MKALLDQVVRGGHLSRDDATRAFEDIISGGAEPLLVAALLAALATRGETVDEIAGATRALRRHMTPLRCPADAVDTCGTGGDGISTFNVSTAAAIIAAGAGVPVAKHGNRTSSRASGSAEVLEALGVCITADVATVERCIAEAKVGFLYARSLHPAMKHAAPIRAALGIRTIFNLLGPLANPGGVTRQVLGVAQARWQEPLARVLRELGARHVWVVHGEDGLCDLTVTGRTRVVELRDGAHRSFTVHPQECGLTPGSLDDLRVESPSASARAIRSVLQGEAGPHRDHALLNAGAAILVGGRADTLGDGVALAARAVDSGAAAAALDTLVERSHGR